MKPEEIKPDTGLCTILGHNAQTGHMRTLLQQDHESECTQCDCDCIEHHRRTC